MFCPVCKKNVRDRTVHSHESYPEGRVVKRRHECPECTSRWTTYETMIVLTRSGDREDTIRRQVQEAVAPAGVEAEDAYDR